VPCFSDLAVVRDRDAQAVEREDLVTSGVPQRHELQARIARGVSDLSDEIASLHEPKCRR
jgi:hypothetical protein